jgi:diguanylate cyclase (GGDEF)-like protein
LSALPVVSADQLDPEISAAPGDDPLVAGEFGLITRGITLRTGAETGVLAVYSQTDRFEQVLAAWGAAPEGAQPLVSLPGGGFVGRVLESGKGAAEPIVPEHDRTLGVAASGARITYGVGAAIRPPGGPPGALCVGFTSRPADTALALWQVESYARLASLCLHEQGMLDALLAAAHVDGLTGCLNYAAVRVELEREIRRAERHGRPVSCCFIDLDHFKDINDRYGHLYGNQVLARVAAVLRQGVRVGDTIGRYGGDEFLAILPDADEMAACAMGERLRSRIFTTRARGIRDQLDTSIGVAQWRPGSAADELLGAADAALLRAKDGGGGIVVGAGGIAAGARRGAARGPRR